MPKVRTRMQPGVEIDVPDDEYEVLKSGGLLAADPAPATATKTTATAQPPAAPSTTTGAPTPAADTTTKKG